MNLSEPWVTHTLEYSLCIHSGKKSLRYDLAHALSIESLSVLFFIILQKEWIYVDTTPLYAMVRYSGTALGLASVPSLMRKNEHHRSILKIALSLICFSGIGYASHWVHQNLISNEDMILFYLYEYILNAFTVFLLLKLSNRF